METPAQRLAQVSKEHLENLKRYNSPLAQVQRRHSPPDNAQWEKDSLDHSKSRVVSTIVENRAMTKMNNRSGKGSPLATTMSKVSK